MGDVPAVFLLAVPDRGFNSSDETPTKIIAVPHLSLLATDSWNGKVVGLNELNQQYQQQYGPGDYVPNVFIAYWSMRAMAYLGTVIVLLALWGVAPASGQAPRVASVPSGGGLGGRAPDPDQHRRLGPRRTGVSPGSCRD